MFQCAVISNLPWDVWDGGLSGWRERYRDIWLYFTQGGPPSQSRFTIPLSFRTRQTYSTIQSAQRIGKKYNNEKSRLNYKALLHHNGTLICGDVWCTSIYQVYAAEQMTWNYLFGNTTSVGCLTNQNLGKLPLHFNMPRRCWRQAWDHVLPSPAVTGAVNQCKSPSCLSDVGTPRSSARTSSPFFPFIFTFLSKHIHTYAVSHTAVKSTNNIACPLTLNAQYIKYKMLIKTHLYIAWGALMKHFMSSLMRQKILIW